MPGKAPRGAAMKLLTFQYLEPKSIGEACSLPALRGVEAPILADGTDLLMKMKLRRVLPEYVINLKTLPGLDYIRCDESNGLRISVLTTIQSIKNSMVASFGWWFPEEKEALFGWDKSNINVLTKSEPPCAPGIGTSDLGDFPCRVYPA